MITQTLKEILNYFLNHLRDNCPKSVRTSIILLEEFRIKPTKFRRWRTLENLKKSIHDLKEIIYSNPGYFDANHKEALDSLIKQSEAFEKISDYRLKLESYSSMKRRDAIYELHSLGDYESIPLIKKLLLKENKPDIRVSALYFFKESLGLDSEPSEIPFIEKLLKNKDILIREEAVILLTKLNSRQSREKVEALINENNKGILKKILEYFMKLFPNEKRYHRLYEDYLDDKKFFSSETKLARREFVKTGSKTILLGGRFIGKVIIRIIDKEPLEQWRRAFEAEEEWRNAGFDYIPVEPILRKNGKLRIYRTKDERYRVYTKVLGPNLSDFIEFNPELGDQLVQLGSRIISVLSKKLKILHGHPHTRNFCVENYDGQLRLYIIDFD